MTLTPTQQLALHQRCRLIEQWAKNLSLALASMSDAAVRAQAGGIITKEGDPRAKAVQEHQMAQAMLREAFDHLLPQCDELVAMFTPPQEGQEQKGG